MMLDLKVPVFPESVADGTLVTWHKKVGEAVRRDEIIADIETDKVVFEVPATDNGVLTEILEQAGATVLSGQVIARLELNGKASAASTTNTVAANTPVLDAIVTPSAQKLIKEKQLSVNEIKGSGKAGRILKEDVLKAIDTRVPNSGSSLVDAALTGARPEKRVPMTRLRARIAERLLEAQHNAAILTTFNEVNMHAVMDLRERYREAFEKSHGVRLGFMAFFIKAAVEALKRFPDVNASIDGSDVLYHGYFDIGIAVGSPRGLIVPILRDADQLSFADLEKRVADFGQRAKDGSLSLEDITGGTFSISNGGVFGSLLSTPILNPPQSAILGMHKIEKRPVVENDAVVIRPMMYLALSYDHRLVDGRGAVQFLVTIKELIEDPTRLLFDL